MKKAFQILKDRPQLSIILTRDSVCAGDDIDAPHKKLIKIHSFVDPEVLTREASSGYLPSVSGVGHSWICVLNNNEIAVIKVNEIVTLTREASFEEENRIHFIYKSSNY